MLEVFYEDKFTAVDSMGVAELNVTDISSAAKLDLKHASGDTRIKTIYQVGTNYLVGQSHVSWKNCKVVQDLILKLKNVDSGSIVLQLEWVHIAPVTDQIWLSRAPFGCKIFAWLASRARCWTADRLSRRGLPHPAACPLCDQEPETIQHLLIGCVAAGEVWSWALARWAKPEWLPDADTDLVQWWSSLTCPGGDLGFLVHLEAPE